jgi:phosphoglycerol transferase MdoB-like AlkP superfamily enzyme
MFFWKQIGNLGKRLGWLLAWYYVLRLVFYFFNFPVFREAGIQETALAFLNGLRFDLSAIGLINLPFVIFSLLPFAFTLKKRYQFFLKTWFVITNFPFLCLNLIDIEYFKFIGRRTSNELFSITNDIQSQAGQLVLHYWYFLFFGAGLLIIFWKGYPKAVFTSPMYRNYTLETVGLLLSIGFSILFIRGGLGLKPLRPANAFMRNPAILGHVSLNSTFTFIKSINDPVLETRNYFPDQQAAAAALNFDPEKYAKPFRKPRRDNVVILILESFGSEYNGIENGGKNYTPFLDSLAAHATLYRENYANGRKSIEALPSILAGLPSLMDQPYITSTFQSNKIYGIGSIVKEAGYKTSFFHGAENGTMGFNTFSKIAGFDQYFGLKEYPSAKLKTDFDGQWGILDEPYLQYFAHKLTAQQQPFLSAVFTLSSHQPYPVPEKYKGLFPKGELPIHESIGYTDFALRKFFKTAAKQPWYKNTLFILTADHTQESANPDYQNELGRFKVPLILFHPSKKLPQPKAGKITQQADIPATIADYLHIPTTKLLPFGNSVLDTSTLGRAIYFTDENYVLVHSDLETILTANESFFFNRYQTHLPFYIPNPDPNLQVKYQQELKGLVQYFRNGMVENNLYFWENKRP